MAKLGKPYPFPEPNYTLPWEEDRKKQEDALAAIPQDRIYSYPHADGQALYYIESLKPPVLRHIAYGDAWELPAAHIRGLRTQDLERAIERAKIIWKLFPGSSNGE